MPAYLTGIPVELRLSIVSFLDPWSCFHLALTCREFHTLLSPRLSTSKQLWTRYNTIETRNAGRLIWDVTKEVAENPSIAQYIQDIRLRCDRQWIYEPGLFHYDLFVSNLPPLLPKSLVQTYMKCVQEIVDADPTGVAHANGPCYGYTHGELGGMEDVIRLGSDIPLILILLSLATNLRTLRLSIYNHQNWSPFWRIAEMYSWERSMAPLPFQHLTRVAVLPERAHRVDWDQMNCEIVWAHLILTIPTVTSFAASLMGEGSSTELHSGIVNKKSKVQELLFKRSRFDPEYELERIIKRTEALISFTYEDGGVYVTYDGSFAPRRVTEILSKHSAHSLENLYLYDNDIHGRNDHYGEIAQASLHSFKKLKTLCCPWRVVTGEMDEQSEDELYTEKDLRQVFPHGANLPRSLEVLHLDGEPEERWHWDALFDLLRTSATCLPKLKQLWATNSPPDVLRELEDLTRERGIVLKPLPSSIDGANNPLAELLER
ncbi:hypothetical protein DM02DRAFT_619174 [Periconia macrospinosa]|uniref:F-box domain-containing protein n=1 Tax=Periconia macrospinosa TaxID=97972 RepID=A0A2V1D7P8_9PLEO|nr:hypothetical protein DM02DRAFT_619174 [Periconia macrospinosa]